MKALRYIWMLVLIAGLFASASAQKRNRVVILHSHMMVQIYMRSSKTEIDSILKIAGIKELTAAMVQNGNFAPAEKNGWNINRKKDLIEMDISLADLGETRVTPYLISTTVNKVANRPGYPAEVLYGINSFNKVTVHDLPSGLTRFFVPGNTDVRRVILSGSFNNWSTIKGLMNKTDSGWVTDVNLEPGKYAYKFIINSNWTPDTYNNLLENDGIGNMNSIYYRYNYTFKLSGYASVKQVAVTGSFNKWGEIPLRRSKNGWQASLYIHDGIHLYRFITDGKAITDPANVDTQADGRKTASVLKLGEEITFKLLGYSNAKKVYVAGNFNNWNPVMLPLQHNSSGWILPYTLPAGNYLYKFIVDGQWIRDPLNPHQITIDGNTNSFLAVRPNFTFRLKGYVSAREVILPGSFNDWNESGYTMARKGDEWMISLRLKPGKYLYKFLIDGKWILDPANKLWEQNQFDTGNSVLWIE